MIRALRDPDGANLDRIQIIKGWLDKDGKTHERIYDVACSDSRSVKERRCEKPVGSTVDIANATYTNTIGDYTNNLTLSAGYAGITYQGEGGSAPLLSIAFIINLSQNFSLVGDSFIFLGQDTKFSLLIPGLRYSKANTRAFQFGLAGVVVDGVSVPVPIPIISFFRAF